MGSLALPSTQTRPRRRRIPAAPVLQHGLVWLLLLFTLIPLAILFANALRTTQEIQQSPIGIPRQWVFENFALAWETAEFSTAFVNTGLLLLLTVPVICAIAAMSSYSLVRIKPAGSNAIATYYLLAMTVPAQLYLVPLFVGWTRLHLTNNLLGLAIVYWALYQPFSIFLLRSYTLGLPEEIEDAARVDGCSELQVLTKIVLPLSKPVMATLAVILTVWIWNEFLFATTMLHAPELKTIALSFVAFTAEWETDFAQQSAAGVIVALPVMILFLALQRRFIQGILQGGLKM
jgi:raffinose/stachyose/melibiose transport system permease protein